MRLAIVYHSSGGNTKALTDEIAARLPKAEVFRVTEFDPATLCDYDGLLIGTYTWGSGEIPRRMVPFYEAIQDMDISHLRTAVYGTGETSYRFYCGAVNQFTNILNGRSQFVATLKVEQMLQESDLKRVDRLCELMGWES